MIAEKETRVIPTYPAIINSIDYDTYLYDDNANDDYIYEKYNCIVEGKEGIVKVIFRYDKPLRNDIQFARTWHPDYLELQIRKKDKSVVWSQHRYNDNLDIIGIIWRAMFTLSEEQKGKIPCKASIHEVDNWDEGWAHSNYSFIM